MGYSNIALKDRIISMHPQIHQHKISVGLVFDDEKSAYVVKFIKKARELTTYIDKSEADECMDGAKCIHLGMKIGEFIKNCELEE